MIRRLLLFSPSILILAVLGAAPVHAQLTATQAVTVDNGTGMLYVVDSTMPTPVASVFLGQFLADVTLTPDGSNALVTRFDTTGMNLISVDLATMSPTWTTAVPLPAVDVDVSCTSTGFAVITDGFNNLDPSVGTNIVSVELGTGAEVSNLFLDLRVQSNAISPDGTLVLATAAFDDVVRVIDMAPDGTLTDTGQNVAAGITPRNVTISPDGTRALVANAGSTVSVLDLSGPTVSNIGNLAFAGSSLQSSAFTLAGDHAYVMDVAFSRVYVLDIDPLGNVTQAGFITHSGPAALSFLGVDQVAVSPDGARVFARHPGGVSVLDTALGVEAASVSLGSNGGGVATLCDVDSGCEEPVITSGLTDTLANEGDAVTFSVTATGDPAPTYQWYKDGSPLAGETSDSLTIDPVTAADAGEYSVVASNECGDASSSAQLSVNQAPTITCNTPVELWSPNHRLIDVSSVLEVQDADGDPVTLTIRVFSDEDELSGEGSGNHAPDFKNELGGRGLLVRGERDGEGDGRWYALAVTADDGQGGVTTMVCGAASVSHGKNQAAMASVMAQLAAGVADIQAAIDAAAPGLPALPLPGHYEVGLSQEVGPKQ